MTATKIKKPTVYGDDLPITVFQIKRIMQNCGYNKDMKDEWVQWVTADIKRNSLKSITQAQAVKILRQQTGETLVVNQAENYAVFDKENPKHKLILSLCLQANWTVTNVKYGEVADLNRLDQFLKSDRAPVSKPLKKMDAKEIQRTIAALGGIVKSIYK
jgi:hypothetical protein